MHNVLEVQHNELSVGRVTTWAQNVAVMFAHDAYSKRDCFSVFAVASAFVPHVLNKYWLLNVYFQIFVTTDKCSLCLV